MSVCLQKKIKEERRALSRIANAGVFVHPERLFDVQRMRMTDLEDDLERAISQILLQKKNELAQAAGELRSLDPLSVLARGYAAITKNGETVSRAFGVEVGDALDIRFVDGIVQATVRGKDKIYDEENHV